MEKEDANQNQGTLNLTTKHTVGQVVGAHGTQDSQRPQNNQENQNLGKRNPKPTQQDPDKDERNRMKLPLWACVSGVRKFMSDFEIYKELKKIFKDKDVEFDHLIKQKNQVLFFVKLKDETSYQAFKSAFPFKIKNRKVKFKEAVLSKTQLKRARTTDQLEEIMKRKTKLHRTYRAPDPEFLKSMTKEKIVALMKERICAFHGVRYEEQILRKRSKLEDYLVQIKAMGVAEAKKVYTKMAWVTPKASKPQLEEPVLQPPNNQQNENSGTSEPQNAQEAQNEGGDAQKSAKAAQSSTKDLCCEISQFIECDEKYRKFYRNKNEFTIGVCALTGKARVGFNVGVGQKNFHTIEIGDSPEDSVTCPESAFEVVKITEKLVNESRLPVWSKFKVGSKDNGFWRNLIVRQSLFTKEMLVNLVGQKLYFENLSKQHQQAKGPAKEDIQENSGVGAQQDHQVPADEGTPEPKLEGPQPDQEEEVNHNPTQEQEDTSSAPNTKIEADAALEAADLPTFDQKIKEWFVQRFIEEFEKNPILSTFTLKGLTYQDSDAHSDSIPYIEDTGLELLHGEGTTYNEKVCSNTFEVSNSSFLQINTAQMDKMYSYVGTLAKLDSETILLDICSGIGTIGLSVGQDCKKVIGIEMVASSCENARKNAQKAGNTNYEVVCGKVEDVIEKIVTENQGNRLVGIIDPPRAGLHPKVVKALRTCKGLDELVFMACDLNQSKRNILDLCAPAGKKRRGPPFSPILATGVDMFPNTPHFESIFYLRRLYED